ncbi:MAG: phenylacetate-CoA oxygenase subunit PaaI [Deltaproteobacteria bacterium]|nr:phenylacetate-CoA oxygenase subunit PaaI [Deltaproteobacteria bacterium]
MSVSRSVQWGELAGMRKVETVEQMPEEYKTTLIKVIYALASTEFASVEQHQPWINQGPTPEDRYIQAQIAADEAHQGFIDCRLLRSFGPEGEEKAANLLNVRMGEHLLSAFNVPFESWVDVCGFCFLLDLVAWYHLRGMENCSFAPLAREMTSMVHEERFHASFGARRIRDIVNNAEYAGLCGATAADAQRTVDKWYPHALDTFGASESKFSKLSVAYGIRRWDNETLRQMYKKDIDAQIAAIGLRVPDPEKGRKVR